MLIGFDGSRAFSPNRTGTENYSYQLLFHLAKIDHSNHYLVYLRPGNKLNRGDWPDNFQFRVINYQLFWTQLGLAVELIKHPPDLLLVTAHTYPLVHLPSLKIIMTVHDLGAEYLPGLHQLKQRLYLHWITRHQLHHATKLIAVSEATKQDLISQAHCQPERIAVIYEGLDRDWFKPVSVDRLINILEHFDIEKESYFMFVGTVQPRKNLERLIQAFSVFRTSHPDIKLVIAGSKGWLSDSIYVLPAQLNIDSSVKFLGRVDDEQLRALYQGAIGLVFPSLYEGFGLPILEAFAMSCPVITSNTSSMPEIAGPAAILVDPTKTSSIAEAMESILDHKLRTQLVAKGRAQLNQFSWQKCAQETLQLMEEINHGQN